MPWRQGEHLSHAKVRRRSLQQKFRAAMSEAQAVADRLQEKSASDGDGDDDSDSDTDSETEGAVAGVGEGEEEGKSEEGESEEEEDASEGEAEGVGMGEDVGEDAVGAEGEGSEGGDSGDSGDSGARGGGTELDVGAGDGAVCIADGGGGGIDGGGALVWAKLASFPWWPAAVATAQAGAVPPSRGDLFVQFFGTRDFAWLEGQATRPFAPSDSLCCVKLSKRSLRTKYRAAVEQATKQFSASSA